MLVQIINLSEISQLAKDQHFTTILLLIAIFAVVTALVAVWRRSEKKDEKLEDCYNKHLENAKHMQEMKELLVARKRRTSK